MVPVLLVRHIIDKGFGEKNFMKQKLSSIYGILVSDGFFTAVRVANRYVRKRIVQLCLQKHPIATIQTIKIQTRFHPNRTDADPFKSIQVDPQSITHAITDGSASSWGIVESGSWDKEVEQFKERSYCKAIETLIEQGDSDKLERELAQIPDYSSSPRYSSGGIEERVKEIRSLEETMRRHGYRSQEELLSQDEDYHQKAANDPVPAELNEILVDIGRDGEVLYRWCGQNRLRLAQLLGLDTVVVIVARRHSEWQATRDEIRSTNWLDGLDGETSDKLSHPDLQDLNGNE
ncbi:hypothetical protein QA600_19625 [Natronococcus sp. A-GB1]|uniref:hypothetical protein n=1 Tax=Natronococcus sp. A-GB1 TaxID=3037648 RepID=UPI00241D5DC3|nr:hypothetical protein [Natronococcus sp. A-GB1]MDG5761545.1 hypothetical protein [Natronococcus sp. A-GB1]